MNISVIVPLLNESESIPELVAWIKRVMDEHQYTYEVLMIDDGSTDNSWAIIEELHQQNPNVKGIRFRRNYGKSRSFKVMWSSRWTPTFRTVPTRFPSSTA